MADEIERDYPVTDKKTGDRWVIRATSPERAKEIASLRRAAKQGSLKYESPADEPTLLGFAKEFVEAPYKGEPEDLPGPLSSLGRTYSEGGKVVARALTPPGLRERFFGKEEPSGMNPLAQAGTDVMKVIGMAPPVAAMTAVADTAGKVTRNLGGSPLGAGIASQIAGLIYPSATRGLSKMREARFEGGGVNQFGTRFGKAEAERISEAQKATLRAAEELKQRRSQLAAAQEAETKGTEALPSGRLATELKGQRTATKEAETAEAAAKTEAEKSVRAAEGKAAREAEETRTKQLMSESEARQAIDDLRTFPEVAKAAADAARKRIAKVQATPFEFGEQFKGPEFQPRGQPKQGYYRESEELRRTEANERYAEARATAGDKPLPAETVLEPILEDLKRDGVPVQILPTKAERTAGRMEAELDPLTHEQRAYGDILDRLTPEQRAALKAGSAGGTIPLEIYRALFQDVLPESARAGVSGEVQGMAAARGMVRSREAEVLQAIDSYQIPKELTVNETIGLHSRLNGAIRAAERSKDFALARQFRRYKDAVDRAIGKASPEALGKLAEADLFYARDYAPYFDPRSKLYKINQQKAASIVDSLVSKDDPRLTQKALAILSDEGKDALRGAWVQRVFENALDDFSGTFSPKKLAESYRSYLPEVRNMILGDGAKEMDGIIDALSSRVKELNEIKRKAGESARQAREALPGVRAAGKEAVGEAKTRAKEMTGAAEARTKEARGAELETQKRLARQTSWLEEERAARQKFTETAQDLHDKAAVKLAEQTVEFAKSEMERMQPKGLHQLLGMSNMQVQATLGLIDVAEWAGGVGGRRYLIFAARHGLVYLLAKNPKLLGYISRGGKNTLSVINRAINGNPLDPNYLKTARAAFLLAEQANFQEARENVGDQAGTENQESH